MTPAVIAYAVVVGGLLSLAVLAVDATCRLARLPSRWTWLAGLVATPGVLLASLVFAHTELRPRPSTSVANAVQTSDLTPSNSALEPGLLARTRQSAGRAVDQTKAALEERLPQRFGPWYSAIALSLTALVASLLLFVHRHFGRRRREWPASTLHDVPVRIARASGPAVMGIRRPEIVVPQWLLLRTPDEQRLVLEHEMEHVIARDPVVLALGWICVALVPWHPLAWWMLSRLRFAVEIDCDARVLRRGVSPRAYGSVLLELSAHRSGLPAIVPALIDRTTQLERRLIAMDSRRPSFAAFRGTMFATAGIVALLSACEVDVPTAIAQADGAFAEQAARQLSLVAKGDSAPRYFVNGVEVTRDVGTAIAAAEIASIEVVRNSPRRARGEIHITTTEAAKDALASKDGTGASSLRVSADTVRLMGVTDGHVSFSGFPNGMLVDTAVTGEPMIFLDGVLTDRQQLSALIHRLHIVNIEIIRGDAATKRYGSKAAHGVMLIKTNGARLPKG